MSVDKNIKVLLVEDSKVSRKMEKKAIIDAGFANVVDAENGQDAIDKLQANPDVGLIISDWNMPLMDGYQFLVWVRQNGPNTKVPFIMATARGEKKQATAATEAGVSNFITKPFGPDELRQLIDDTFVGGKKADTSAPLIPQTTAGGRLLLNVAHIQITDHLTLGVLKNLIENGKIAPKHFELQTSCMPSWNSLQGALEKGSVDAAFVLAPIAMDLYGFGVPIKLVLFAHKNGSISVLKKSEEKSKDLKEFFRGKTFYLPHEMSIHHMLAHMFLTQIGLKPGFFGRGDFDVLFEVVPPVKMPEFLASNPEACGYLVAEPLGTKAIAEGIADLLFLSGELWESHPCCVVTVRDEIINQYPDAVQEFTTLLVEAGKFIGDKPETAAEIGVNFLDPNKTLNLKVPVLKNVLKEMQGIKTNDLFPVVEDLDRIQQYMVHQMGIGTIIYLNEFVDMRFAKIACKDSGFVARRSTMKELSSMVGEIVSRQKDGFVSKTNLNKEGQYLIFKLNTQEYGIDILWVREIVSMKSIRSMPKAPYSVKGIINLRDRIIPIVDLRLRLGLESLDDESRARIIVLENETNNVIDQIGVVVDSVSDVMNIKAEHIEEPPSYKNNGNDNFILAMANMEAGIKILLDTKRFFAARA
jgi:chemotaxis signal transduction protein/ABC-type nitrate/sulfonate/bicarbonate transport system substrate-binding protein/CheY-like chemotaxis protein